MGNIVSLKELEKEYSTVVDSEVKLFNFNFKEIWKYKDLILLFVRRTFVAQYKQTVLGPAWAVIQPLFTTVIFTIVFGGLAGLAPSGVPSFVFYYSSSILWTYFSGCLTSTASTFTSNSAILGKVYFPRLVMPISSVISQLISFGIQYLFFVIFLLYYLIFQDSVAPNIYILLTPVLIIHLASLSLGFGVIVSALTTKYRDLVQLISFGVQLWMYASPIIYDIGIVPDKYLNLYMLNPVTPIINTFRYAYLGLGEFNLHYYAISLAVTLVVLLISIILLNRIEKTFMDTI